MSSNEANAVQITFHHLLPQPYRLRKVKDHQEEVEESGQMSCLLSPLYLVAPAVLAPGAQGAGCIQGMRGREGAIAMGVWKRSSGCRANGLLPSVIWTWQ